MNPKAIAVTALIAVVAIAVVSRVAPLKAIVLA
jgi:hypothetical protein